MIRLWLSCVAAAAALTVPAATAAQEVKVDEVTGVKRHLVTFYKFGPSGRGPLRDIIWGTFLPAMREAGTPLPIILHPDDGEWDMVAIYELPAGYTDLHFNVSPTDSKWQSVAVRKVGQKAFDEMSAKWRDAIVRQQSFIAHQH